MSEIDFREKVDKCKNTLVYFLEHNYVPQKDMCVSQQFAYQLVKKRDNKNTPHYVTFLSIDDTLWPQTNDVVEQALIELVKQHKIFNGKTGKFYLHIRGTELFDETNLKTDRDKTNYFLAVPVEKKKF